MEYEKLSHDRQVVTDKIKEYERAGIFDKDVEDDPPTEILLPNRVDYLNKKLSSKIKSYFANRAAVRYFEKEFKKKRLVYGDVTGIENFKKVKGGAIVTCNHFSIYDHYVVYKTLLPYLRHGRIYKIIREGNYTSMQGIFGMFFKHCNTLPLSSNVETMKKFFEAIDVLLARGEKILVFPEQAMWWNYKKPRPMKNGAFRFAVKYDVPVIPIFITLKEYGTYNDDGSPVYIYNINIAEPIYRKCELSERENVEYLKNANYDVWKNIYENYYGKKLIYGD